MTGPKNIGWILCVTSLSVIASIGCDETEESDSTPTPSPIPSVDEYFRVTSLVTSDDGGVDIDEDGEPDNNLDAVMTLMESWIYDTVASALNEAEIPETCETDDPAEICQEEILAQVEQALDQIFSDDNLAESLNTPVEEGTATYMVQLEGPTLDQLELSWLVTDSFSNSYVWTQTGAIDETGAGTFGPSSWILPIYIEYNDLSSAESVLLEVDMSLESVTTEVYGYSSQDFDFSSAAAIPVEDWVSLASAIFTAITESLLPEMITIDYSDELLELESDLLTIADIDLDDDGVNDAISASISGSAVSIELEE